MYLYLQCQTTPGKNEAEILQAVRVRAMKIVRMWF